MAKLVSDFALLAGDNDPDRLTIYGIVYAELARIGAAVPGRSSSAITHDQLVTHLQQAAAKLVKQELQKIANPDYSGKSDTDQAALLDTFQIEHGAAPPVNLVLIGFPFAPNALTADDVKGSKNGAAVSAQG